MKIAVVGAGITGLGAAWLLARKYEVTLYEASDYAGGHAHTVDITVDGRRVPVDTGFIVYNEHNYPNLTRLFAHLDVATVDSDMSFAVSVGDGRFEYTGSAAGILAQPSNLLRPGYWRMLRDLVRFYREAPALMARGALDHMSLGELLSSRGYSRVFAQGHLLPMAAAIWSSTLDDILEFPARVFVQFFENHGLFSLGDRPQWRSVQGGCREYVEALLAPFRGRLCLATPVAAVRRTPVGVFLRDRAGHEACYDQIVLATQADQALAILGDDAAPAESGILGAFRYQDNHAVLHRDPALMPRRRNAWASWNYLTGRDENSDVLATVTYWMNRLQRLDTAANIFVTLNPYRPVAPDKAFGRYTYRHPQFDGPALAAQTRLPTIQGVNRTWYCGSYCGYGFHEDGLQAGLGVAAALGAAAPWSNAIVPMSPALQAVTPAGLAVAAE